MPYSKNGCWFRERPYNERLGKGATTRAANALLGRSGAFWQREYFDRIVRDETELMAKLEYIVGNPYARWPETQEYPWVGCNSWFSWGCGDSGYER